MQLKWYFEGNLFTYTHVSDRRLCWTKSTTADLKYEDSRTILPQVPEVLVAVLPAPSVPLRLHGGKVPSPPRRGWGRHWGRVWFGKKAGPRLLYRAYFLPAYFTSVERWQLVNSGTCSSTVFYCWNYIEVQCSWSQDWLSNLRRKPSFPEREWWNFPLICPLNRYLLRAFSVSCRFLGLGESSVNNINKIPALRALTLQQRRQEKERLRWNTKVSW